MDFQLIANVMLGVGAYNLVHVVVEIIMDVLKGRHHA